MARTTIENFIMGDGGYYESVDFINLQRLQAGSNNTFIDCTFSAHPLWMLGWTAFVLTATNRSKSTVGNRFIGCTFQGGLEEQTGTDSHTNAALWAVAGKTANTLTLTLVRDPYNKRYVYGAGCHAIIANGDGIGNYYAVTARNGDTFTLDTRRFSTADVAVGDHVSVTPACVENEWTDCTAITSAARVERLMYWNGEEWLWGGNGQTTIPTAFSIYENSVGNTFTRCHAIGSGHVTRQVGWADEVTQTGFWDRSWSQNNHSTAVMYPTTDGVLPASNHHNHYIDCDAVGVDQAFNGGAYQLGVFGYNADPDLEDDAFIAHQDALYPHSHIIVSGCDFTGGQEKFPNWFGNVTRSVWAASTDAPTNLYGVYNQRFGQLWASDMPYLGVADPYPGLTRNIGDAAPAGVEYLAEPWQPPASPRNDVSIITGAGGATSVSTITVEVSVPQTFTATPSAGYRIASITASAGVTVTPAASGQTGATEFTVTATQAGSVSVEFELVPAPPHNYNALMMGAGF